MASSLEKKQIDELLAKQQAIAVRAQRRVDELEQRNKHLLEQIVSSLAAPATAFGVAYARAYFGDEKSSILGVPIDAAVGLGLHALGACVGLLSDNDSQSAATILHSFANGALSSWSASLGAELGAQKRLERPPPQPDPGEKVTPVREPRQMTRAELDAAVAAMRWQAQLAMPERTPAPAAMPQFAPLPIPVPQATNPLPTAEPVAAQAPAPPAPLPRPHAPPPASLPPPVEQKANPLPTAKPEAAQALAPAPSSPLKTPPPHTSSGGAKPWVLDPEAEMRALLQSHGAPSDPKTVAYVLTHENSIEAYRQSVGRARPTAEAPSTTQKSNRATTPWVLDPEAEMRALLQSHGAPSDPKTVTYVLMHENSIEAFRQIVRGAQVPTTSVTAAKAPTPAPVLQSSTPPQTPSNAPPVTKKKPRRSLGVARAVGITEAAVVASPRMPPKPKPLELPKQVVQESNHSAQLTEEELKAAERWRLATAA